MTLTDCQIFMTVSQLGTFAAAAEQMHLTPSAISHAVSGMESECGFLLFTRTKSGVTMTAAAESLLPSIRQMLDGGQLLSQSIAQVNGMHDQGRAAAGGVQLGLRHLGATIGAAVSKSSFPASTCSCTQGSYADIVDWLKGGTVELGFLSNSSARDLDFEPLYDDPLVCIAPADYQPHRPGCVRAEELQGRALRSARQSDVDADIQSYFKKNDLHVNSRCYIVDDQSMIAMVSCGQGLAIMPELMFRRGTDHSGCQVLRLEPAAKRSIGLACLSRGGLSPAAKQFVASAQEYATTLK